MVVGLKVYENQINTPSTIAARQIPPNDLRSLEIPVRTSGGTTKINLALSIANFVGQTFQPILLVNVLRDGKTLTKGPQDFVRIPIAIAPSVGFNRLEPFALALVDNDVKPGCHNYSILLINQSLKADGVTPTFLELDVVDPNVTVPDPDLALNQLSTNQSFPPSGTAALTLLPFSSIDLPLEVSTTAETIEFAVTVNFVIPLNTILILEYDFLFGNESIVEFNGPQRIALNGAASGSPIEANFPLYFCVWSNKKRCTARQLFTI